MPNLTRHGKMIAENIERSRIADLEETEGFVSEG